MTVAALLAIGGAIWALPARVRKGIPEPPEPPDLDALTTALTEIEEAANRASDRVNRLDGKLEAQAATDYRRSVIQTLFGTLIGLLGGYSASWVDQGGALFPDGALLRVATVTTFGVLFALLAPICVFPLLDRLLVWLNAFWERLRGGAEAPR